MASIVDDRGFNQGWQWSRTNELRMRRRARAIVDAVAPAADHRILELGCGTGELANMLAAETPARVTGVDLCQPFVDEANRKFARAKLNFVAADLSDPREIERLGDDWAAIVGNGILHHLHPVIDDALPQLRRLLRPGGRFVFWEPNLHNPYVLAIFGVPPLRRLAKLEPTEMAFTPGWIRTRLERAGYTGIDVRYRDFLVPGLPWPLVPLATRAGDVAERIPGVDRLAQSLFIVASAPR